MNTTRYAEHIEAELAALLGDDPETAYFALEGAHDVLTQYRSECALYGDAGPGQGPLAASASRLLNAHDALWAELRRCPTYGPAAPVWGPVYNEPF